MNEQFRSVAFLRFRKIISTNTYIYIYILNSIRIERKFREKFDQFNISIESESIRAEKYKWFEKIKKKKRKRELSRSRFRFPNKLKREEDERLNG